MKDYFILLNNPQKIDLIKEKLLINYGIDIMQILKKKDESILFDKELVDNLFYLCQNQVLSYENDLFTLEYDCNFHLKQHCIIAALYNIEYLLSSGECHITRHLFHERFSNLKDMNIHSKYTLRF